MPLKLTNKKQRQFGLAVSLGIHSLLIVVFLYISAWYSMNSIPTKKISFSEDSSLNAPSFSRTSTKDSLSEDEILLEKIKKKKKTNFNQELSLPAKSGNLCVLKLNGWQFDCQFVTENPNSESGLIIFDITIDSTGKLIAFQTQKTEISLSTIKIYQKKLEQNLQNCLTPTQKNTQGITKGTISFELSPA
jgi:hypothetical protein